jgi:hypothetical protein
VAAALIVSGFAIALWFESFAVITGREPTISQITALQIGTIHIRVPSSTKRNSR